MQDGEFTYEIEQDNSMEFTLIGSDISLTNTGELTEDDSSLNYEIDMVLTTTTEDVRTFTIRIYNNNYDLNFNLDNEFLRVIKTERNGGTFTCARPELEYHPVTGPSWHVSSKTATDTEGLITVILEFSS